uniref:Uncharacterized protein n=1 Tax=Molossus molossus TaxID=27622 RepID=A0A7J8J6H0_MOLMO|nr:hypothetical protein HJG59_009659 [Molossus molossus]
MQAVDKASAGGTADAGGSLSSPEDQGGTGGPNNHSPLGVLEGQCGPGDPISPGSPDSHSGPCSPPGQGGPGGLGGPGDKETKGSAAIGISTVAWGALASESGRDVTSVVVGAGNQKIVFKWTAEDPGLLHVSVNAFLEKLSVVMLIIQCIWSLFPPSLDREKGTGTQRCDPY